MSHFPQLDRLQRVLKVWPSAFTAPPIGTQPVHVAEATLVVLCQTQEIADQLDSDASVILGLLNPQLPEGERLAALDVMAATRTEMFLAREVLWLKSWLRDFDVGF